MKKRREKSNSRSCFVDSEFIFSKSKRSQISIFIIIGVLLVLTIAIAGLFFFKGNTTVRQFIDRNSVSSEILPVYEAVDNCAEKRFVEAVRIVGLQGGYVNLPQDEFDAGIFITSYGYIKGRNLIPSRTKVQNEIDNYMEMTAGFCNFNLSFENLSIGNAVSKTKINTDSVTNTLTIPVSFKKDNATYSLDKEYSSEVPVKLGDMLDVANKIAIKQKSSGEYVPVTYLTNFNYDIVFYNMNESVVYSIIDNRTSEGTAYNFVFAAKLI